jgi:hypothetical protein|tara:strand:- start:92 stop:454 length:363 start_codon:yes stop_codon:yes gene_type:complete
MDNTMQPTMKKTLHGGTVWMLNGKYHRTDGPAFESDVTNRRSWWKYGERHRTDGPAVESIYGNQWWIDGRLHHSDGPAIEYNDGNVCWYLEGLEYSFEEWLAKTTGLTDEQKVMFKLRYG